MSAAIQMNKLVPLVRTNFGLADHSYRRFNAFVPPGTSKAELEHPDFWDFVSAQIRIHDEIRAVAEDSSFVAHLLVVAKAGTKVYTRVMWGTELDEADLTEASQKQARYIVKMRGRKGWSIVDTETGDIVKENLSKRSLAERELEEFLTALSR